MQRQVRASRRICVVLTTRGNYAKMRSTMAALQGRSDIELQVVLGGALLLSRYGDVAGAIRKDGFVISETCQFIVEGETPAAIAASSALAVAQFSQALARLRPDIVVVIADRYESLALAQAALCLNIPIAHIEGGEVSGSIDERIRHAVTKLSHVHLVANSQSAERVIQMGEKPEAVHTTGTPSLDILREIDLDDLEPVTGYLASHGNGAIIDLEKPYVVVSQHPVATEAAEAADQTHITLAAVRELNLPAIWVQPNNDAGAQAARDVLATGAADLPVRFVGALPFPLYATLLKKGLCLIGNTSSGIREAEYLGVPVVNIGTRQQGRQRGQNVVDVCYDTAAILQAARSQIDHGRYKSQQIYGDGHAGRKIAEILATIRPALDKTITY